MPTLNWIGKDAVIRHHKEVPFRLLEADAALSHGGDTGNLIVQGDNLHALKALLPKYAGKVKCIYIDPPYNTGNEGWVYNDKVNSPEINRWLGSVVGKEAEDLSRHDKWLCMMYPRMVLLKQFLTVDGAIFVSIDDNEVASLRLLMDEIFGKGNFISIIAWLKRVSPANDAKYLSTDHEYVAVFARDKETWRPRKLQRTSKQLDNYKNPDNDPRGPWNSVTYTCNKSAEERPNLFHAILNPNTKKEVWPSRTAVWKYDRNRHEANESKGLVWWGVDGKARMPRLKRFLSEMGDVVPRSFFHYDDTGHTQESRTELLSIIDECPFSTPKPSRLIQRILQIATDKDSIILDSFAGSGTTGHAVLKQNAEDGGTRKFILVEMEGKIARDITAERVRRVAGGYTNAKGEAVAGLGGGFQFCTLSEEPLFNEFGDIRDDVTYAQLADFVWFAETGEGYTGKADSPLLGVKGGTAVYLLFNGILGDRRPQGGNILTQAVLDSLPPHEGPKVIYAAATRLGPAALQRAGIVFKQTPYAIEV
jgi:site-specific DNA-methyltransferase (adenine-specific)/adenine-specific DNA-methyltransferase